MENKTFKMKLSKLFQSSFTSCRNKHNSDIANQPFFFPENHHHRQLINLFSPKPKNPDQKTLFPVVSHAGKPKTAKKKRHRRRRTTKIQDFSSVTDNLYYNCCSSDEDVETDDESHETTLFSSRSFTSDSSVSCRKNKPRRRKNKTPGVVPVKGKFVKDSVAVVKKSRDPHEDFRVSMLEMIVERQIFGAKDLENLLECFLSLNSEEHHRAICDVFTEIWETLFSDCL